MSHDLPDWQIRVLQEKSDLDERIDRLSSYIKDPEFRELDLLKRDLMLRQLGYMQAYSLTLGQRIDDFLGHTRHREDDAIWPIAREA